jgi:hypothetical protein
MATTSDFPLENMPSQYALFLLVSLLFSRDVMTSWFLSLRLFFLDLSL